MSAEQVSPGEMGSSTGAGPSQGPTQEIIPSAMPSHGNALQDGSAEHLGEVPNENTASISYGDQRRQSEQEAAEERQHRRKERELEDQRAKVWIGDCLRVILC